MTAGALSAGASFSTKDNFSAGCPVTPPEHAEQSDPQSFPNLYFRLELEIDATRGSFFLSSHVFGLLARFT